MSGFVCTIVSEVPVYQTFGIESVMKIQIATLALLILCAALQVAGKAETKDSATGGTPALVPGFAAVSAENAETAVEWYRDKLGFRFTGEMNFPPNLKIRIVEIGDFRLEIIEFKESLSFGQVQEKFPQVTDRSRLRGFGKLGFLIQDLDSMSRRLKKADVKFLFDVTRNSETSESWFIIEDCCGNVLQFFERLGRPR
jgi:hypothetical protein